MYLEKVIEILTKLEHTLAPTMTAHGTNAIRIGLRAVQRVVDMRISPCVTADELLEGETERRPNEPERSP